MSDAVLAVHFLPVPVPVFRALFLLAASVILLAGAWLLLAAAAR